ncbi:putative RasGEF domain containing protein [Blattamonas nauphoetae]|uniref:RasGEF domain containing protein n=1 Tax=Blattamonas nauphoetae TaxID=2049346 RepID=A0ABQ9YL75_9EUKA|nr:putative RasGEF domain containing protein [Blattamonas nauphoetae]
MSDDDPILKNPLALSLIGSVIRFSESFSLPAVVRTSALIETMALSVVSFPLRPAFLYSYHFILKPNSFILSLSSLIYNHLVTQHPGIQIDELLTDQSHLAKIQAAPFKITRHTDCRELETLTSFVYTLVRSSNDYAHPGNTETLQLLKTLLSLLSAESNRSSLITKKAKEIVDKKVEEKTKLHELHLPAQPSSPPAFNWEDIAWLVPEIEETKSFKFRGLKSRSQQPLISQFHKNPQLPQSIATTMTIIEDYLIKQIKIDEFVDGAWMKTEKNSLAPGIVRMTSHFNFISRWVPTLVLSFTESEQRAQVMDLFVLVAEELKKQQNYNGMMEILFGLENRALTRLTVSQSQRKKKFKDAKRFLKDGPYFQNVQSQMRLDDPPKIPVIPATLKEIQFAMEKKKDQIPFDLDNERVKVFGGREEKTEQDMATSRERRKRDTPSHVIISPLLNMFDPVDDFQLSVQMPLLSSIQGHSAVLNVPSNSTPVPLLLKPVFFVNGIQEVRGEEIVDDLKVLSKEDRKALLKEKKLKEKSEKHSKKTKEKTSVSTPTVTSQTTSPSCIALSFSHLASLPSNDQLLQRSKELERPEYEPVLECAAVPEEAQRKNSIVEITTDDLKEDKVPIVPTDEVKTLPEEESTTDKDFAIEIDLSLSDSFVDEELSPLIDPTISTSQSVDQVLIPSSIVNANPFRVAPVGTLLNPKGAKSPKRRYELLPPQSSSWGVVNRAPKMLHWLTRIQTAGDELNQTPPTQTETSDPFSKRPPFRSETKKSKHVALPQALFSSRHIPKSLISLYTTKSVKGVTISSFFTFNRTDSSLSKSTVPLSSLYLTLKNVQQFHPAIRRSTQYQILNQPNANQQHAYRQSVAGPENRHGRGVLEKPDSPPPDAQNTNLNNFIASQIEPFSLNVMSRALLSLDLAHTHIPVLIENPLKDQVNFDLNTEMRKETLRKQQQRGRRRRMTTIDREGKPDLRTLPPNQPSAIARAFLTANPTAPTPLVPPPTQTDTTILYVSSQISTLPASMRSQSIQIGPSSFQQSTPQITKQSSLFNTILPNKIQANPQPSAPGQPNRHLPLSSRQTLSRPPLSQQDQVDAVRLSASCSTLPPVTSVPSSSDVILYNPISNPSLPFSLNCILTNVTSLQRFTPRDCSNVTPSQRSKRKQQNTASSHWSRRHSLPLDPYSLDAFVFEKELRKRRKD